MTDVVKPVERACIVCGQGSHREDWIKVKKVNDSTFVACDNHSDAEFSAAVQRATQPAPAKPVEKPAIATGANTEAETTPSTKT